MKTDYCVVIPARNCDQFIAGALASVERQTVRAREVIVVDDGSSDSTVAVARSAGARVVTTSGARGPSAARNTGVAQTTAPLIAFLDADDEWKPDHAATLLPVFADARTAFAGSNAEKFGAEAGLVGQRDGKSGVIDLKDLLISRNPVIQSATIVRRDTFVSSGGYDESLRLSEDYELWTRIVEKGAFHYENAATTRRRMHPDQASQRFRRELVHAWWVVRRRTVARRLQAASQFERVLVLQLLEQAAKLDLDWAIWTGDSAMLAIVRDELQLSDDELGLGTRLRAVGGMGQPALRLSQDVRCGSRSLLQFLQGQR